LADSKSQLEELATVVRETEKERRKILKAYKQVKDHYVETHNCMVGLERDNHILASEVETLTLQLKDMKEYTERISSKQSEWDKHQQQSSAIIRRLKEQIRSTETMIPIGVYKAALESADQEAAKADDYSKRVAALTKQVATLTSRLTQAGKVPPPPPLPSSSSRALQPLRVSIPIDRTPVRPKLPPKNVTPTENKPPESINVSQPSVSSRKAVSFAVDFKSPAEPKSATRMSKIRALGGRKALEEQLRKARSPRNQQF
jgi:hypothetical protein